MKLKAVLAGTLAVTAAMLTGFSALPASAAEPPDDACVGTSLSTLAGFGGRAFGEGIVFFARVGGPLSTQPGFGDGIANFRAGLIPDEVAPNTCND